MFKRSRHDHLREGEGRCQVPSFANLESGEDIHFEVNLYLSYSRDSSKKYSLRFRGEELSKRNLNSTNISTSFSRLPVQTRARVV